MRKAASNVSKNYVLDTNVLLHDPNCLFKFQDNDVVLPVEVLTELDSKKTASGELGRNAREVQRSLRAIFGDDPKGGRYEKLGDTPGGGRIRFVINEWLIRNEFSDGLKRLKSTLINLDVPDNRILASALYVKENSENETFLVTKDVNMALKAQALDLDVQDYKNDKIIRSEEESYQSLQLTENQWNRFVELDTDIRNPDVYEEGVKLRSLKGLSLDLGEYVLGHIKGLDGYIEPLRYLGNNVFRTLPIYAAFQRGNRAEGDLHGLKMPNGGIHVIPRNIEQWTLMDALLDPTTPLVTVKSKAGTGKTFIAVATALHEILSGYTNYEKLFITRPNVDMGQGIGFLPGDQDDKMKPYMQPYYDNLDILFPTSKKSQVKKSPANNAAGGQQGPMKSWEKFKNQGLLEIQPLNSIRGRSLPNCLILVDEAQNLTPMHAKTIATRIGEGAKVVFLGDPAQIDTPYLDAHSNGLVYVRDRMRGQLITSHVKLIDGVRSQIAEMCAELL